MPSKKKKYNARFPAGRIKKIMQSDEEVGKVAQAVPVIISRTLELFVESLLTKTLKITNSRNAKTLSTSHMKQCIMTEQRFDFLRELVRNIPDISVAEEAANYNDEDNQSSPEDQYPDSDTPYDLSMPSTSVKAGRQQFLPPNGHNGGGQQMHTQYHDYQRNLKRSLSSSTSYVMRHPTMSSHTNSDCLPAKYPRLDFTPVPQQLLTQPHHRLKHQSYSMPIYIDNTDKPNINIHLKQLGTTPQQTAIPPPIVNIDYCSKPIVKIDYSNLPLVGETTSNNSVTGPMSAPASMSSNNSAFNFSTQPVINIDLSNIVTTSATATISIGTTTQPSILPSSTTSPITKTKLSSTKSTLAEQKSRNSKSSVMDSLNYSSSVTVKATALAAAVAAATTLTTKTSTTNSESYLEMDEDYDNI